MVQDSPFLMRDSLNDPNQMLGYILPVGLVREFLVTSPRQHCADPAHHPGCPWWKPGVARGRLAC